MNIYDLIRDSLGAIDILMKSPTFDKLGDMTESSELEEKLRFVIQFNNRSDNADEPEVLDCPPMRDLNIAREIARERLAVITPETREFMIDEIEEYVKWNSDGTSNPTIIPYTDPHTLEPIPFDGWKDFTCEYLPYIKIHPRFPIVDIPLFTVEFLGEFQDIWARVEVAKDLD